MTEEAKDKALQEFARLEAMPPMSAESTVSRTYLDWLINVPWRNTSEEINDLNEAERVLNEDHYGLEKIKERILEYLAVRQLVKIREARFCVSSARRASVKLLSENLSPTRRAENSFDLVWAEFTTKPKFAVIAALISARCPVK
jgi:hypothetical protein